MCTVLAIQQTVQLLFDVWSFSAVLAFLVGSQAKMHRQILFVLFHNVLQSSFICNNQEKDIPL